MTLTQQQLPQKLCKYFINLVGYHNDHLKLCSSDLLQKELNILFIGELVAGLFSAFVLIGNHER